MNEIKYHWVDNDDALKLLVDICQKHHLLAFDTEFARSDTFYPHIGLLQLAVNGEIYLIDPLAINEKQPLIDLFQNPASTKILHACSEDMEVFYRYLGVIPQNVFDTQIAAGFCGFGSSIGYANLVKSILDIDVPKQETRSDWLHRPLSLSQLRYAAVDVLYLEKIYHYLIDLLKRYDRLSWVEADCQRLVDNVTTNDGLTSYFSRIKSAWKLPPQQLAALYGLNKWREKEARELDVPRSRVVKDNVLYEMALISPKNHAQLKRIKGLRHDLIETDGDVILYVIEQAKENQQNYPQSLPKPLDKLARDWLKKLKGKVNHVADQLDVPSEYLARKKDLEFLVRAKQNNSVFQLPESLHGWRKAIIGDALFELISDIE